MTKPVPVAKGNAILGEVPLWSTEEQALYWVDVKNPTIHRYDPKTRRRRHWLIETEIGSIGLAGKDRLVAGLRTGLHYVDLETGAIEPICDPEGGGRFNENRLNDGKMDRAGRFWCGSMQDPGHAPVGTLYRFSADGKWSTAERKIRIPNALSWSPDDRTMYFSDSATNQIRAYDFDLASGEIANPRTFATVPEGLGHPDGATVDADGFVWSAHIFGGRITRYDPDGRVERVIELPVPQVTSCAFGGSDLETLYVTTASMHMDRAALAAAPLAGALFAVDVGVRGLPEPHFGG